MIAANAQAKDVSVTVDNRVINFTDQAPVIEDDRVMVPLRDVFNAMGATVEWYGEERKVTVEAKDNRSRLIFHIDSNDFSKLNFVTILEVVTENFTTDVAPKIINDRTMLPLRVVSESFGADVNWDPETYTVTIASKEFKNVLGVEAYDAEKYAEFSKALPAISLSADKETVAAGDSVTLSVNLSNVTPIENANLTGISVAVNYDPERFEYAGCKSIGETETEEPYAISDNAVFKEGVAKVVYVLNPEISHEFKDRKIAEFTFKAKAAGDTEFSVSDTYTAGNNDNFISVFVGDKIKIFDSASLLFLNSDAVKVTVGSEAEADNAEAEAEAETEATAETETEVETEAVADEK